MIAEINFRWRASGPSAGKRITAPPGNSISIDESGVFPNRFGATQGDGRRTGANASIDRQGDVRRRMGYVDGVDLRAEFLCRHRSFDLCRSTSVRRRIGTSVCQRATCHPIFSSNGGTVRPSDSQAGSRTLTNKNGKDRRRIVGFASSSLVARYAGTRTLIRGVRNPHRRLVTVSPYLRNTE